MKTDWKGEDSPVTENNDFFWTGRRSELSEALSESNTSVLADLRTFKEPRVTAPSPSRVTVCGCPLAVLGISPSPGGWRKPGSSRQDYTVWRNTSRKPSGSRKVWCRTRIQRLRNVTGRESFPEMSLIKGKLLLLQMKNMVWVLVTCLLRYERAKGCVTHCK